MESTLEISDQTSDEQIKELFKRYEQVRFFPSPEYKRILNNPLGTITNEHERKRAMNTNFRDLEKVTYFFDFSPKNLTKALYLGDIRLGFFKQSLEDENEVIESSDGMLLCRIRIDEKPISKKLEELTRNGKKVTHIVCAEEIYGGDTNYSVCRTHEKADIYEIVR